MKPPLPSPLPIDRPAASWRLARMVVLGVVQAVVLLPVSVGLNGLTITGLGAALGMVLALGVLNALIWPLVIRVTLPLVMWSVGLFTFVLNAFFRVGCCCRIRWCRDCVVLDRTGRRNDLDGCQLDGGRNAQRRR